MLKLDSLESNVMHRFPRLAFELDQTSEYRGHDFHARQILTLALLGENDHQTAHNRTHFDSHKVLAINLMSSPGSGKTSLLERTIESLKDRYRIAVIEGDLETENDASRIRQHGATAIQITSPSPVRSAGGAKTMMKAAPIGKVLARIQDRRRP